MQPCPPKAVQDHCGHLSRTFFLSFCQSIKTEHSSPTSFVNSPHFHPSTQHKLDIQLTIPQLLKEQCTKVPPAPKDNLSGKTVIVVGADIGIGYEAARHFATMKPGKLILACRDQKRGDAALESIKQETGCQNIEVSLIDLKNFASVNAFADHFIKSGQRLDIVVANAAVLATSLEVTEDGWESGFQINNLSTNLLCLSLLPALSRTSQQFGTSPRVVVVTSELHYWSKLTPKVLEASNPVEMFGRGENCTPKDITDRYPDTKLLNVLFVRALNDRLKAPIIANAVNPGFCKSSLRREMIGVQRFVLDWLMVKVLARTGEEGSRQLVWAAVGEKDQPERLRGAYISSMQVFESSDFVVSEEGRKFQDKLWDCMVEELIKVNPALKEVVSSYLRQ